MADKPKKDKKPSVFKRILSFFKEVKVECFKRITWPTRKQLINNTIVVLVTVLFVGVFVVVLDYVFTSVLQFALEDLPSLLGK